MRFFGILFAALLLLPLGGTPAFADNDPFFDSNGPAPSVDADQAPGIGDSDGIDVSCDGRPCQEGAQGQGAAKNPVDKYGVIINGDTEWRHQENARLFYDFYKDYYGMQDANIYVLTTTFTAKTQGANNVESTVKGLTDTLTALIAKIDDNDLLYVYTTGHGAQGTMTPPGGQPQVVEILALQNHAVVPAEVFAMAIRRTKAARITYVGDQCNSGGFARAMTSDKSRDVLAISSVDPDNSTVCNFFTPPFLDAFKDMKNDNDPKDGRISEWEAFKVATNYSQTAHAANGFPAAAASTRYMTSGKVHNPGQKIVKAPTK
ncbi:MAG: hypothetical protein V3S11_04150 [Elusimicrobiota bacterium]